MPPEFVSGYAFPNDVHIHWSLMIVMYPYITGFVAGAFIVTSLYHVFGRQEFKPVARLAMAAARKGAWWRSSRQAIWPISKCPSASSPPARPSPWPPPATCSAR